MNKIWIPSKLLFVISQVETEDQPIKLTLFIHNSIIINFSFSKRKKNHNFKTKIQKKD